MQKLDRFKFRVWKSSIPTGLRDRMGMIVYLEDESCGYDLPAICEDAQRGNVVLMQSTGLKDKNGKLIYEGDIITYKSSNSDAEVAIVRFNDEKGCLGMVLKKYYLDKSNPNWATCCLNDTYTIIGNIYENPELLKNI